MPKSIRFITKIYCLEHGGLVIYHRQEGRNIGLTKVNAYALQRPRKILFKANLELGFGEDDRDYSIVGYIFNDLGVKSLKLLQIILKNTIC